MGFVVESEDVADIVSTWECRDDLHFLIFPENKFSIPRYEYSFYPCGGVKSYIFRVIKNPRLPEEKLVFERKIDNVESIEEAKIFMIKLYKDGLNRVIDSAKKHHNERLQKMIDSLKGESNNAD